MGGVFTQGMLSHVERGACCANATGTALHRDRGAQPTNTYTNTGKEWGLNVAKRVYSGPKAKNLSNICAVRRLSGTY